MIHLVMVHISHVMIHRHAVHIVVHTGVAVRIRRSLHIASGNKSQNAKNGRDHYQFCIFHIRIHPFFQSFALRSRSALVITETELNVIAALAMIGLRSMPKNG